MGREEDVPREEYKTPWWDGGSQGRVLELRKDQPTTFRVTLYDFKVDDRKVAEALDSVEREAIVELPPEEPAYIDHVAHEVQLGPQGELVIRKIVGVGTAQAGWETLAIYPRGEWKKCEAICFREGK